MCNWAREKYRKKIKLTIICTVSGKPMVLTKLFIIMANGLSEFPRNIPIGLRKFQLKRNLVVIVFWRRL